MHIERVQASGNKEKELRAKKMCEIYLAVCIFSYKMYPCNSGMLRTQDLSFCDHLPKAKSYRIQDRSLKDMVMPILHAELPQKQVLGQVFTCWVPASPVWVVLGYHPCPPT